MGDERFLVTGSSGCIGAWVMQDLLAEGTPAVGFDLDTEPRRFREIAGKEAAAAFTVVRGDITNKDELSRALEEHGITHVVHLAALQIPFCRDDPIRGAQVNVVGTVNVFESVRECSNQVRGVVYASSAGKYGSDDVEVAAADEEHMPHPSTLYGVYKQANESTARIYWQDYGVASIGLRPYNVYGPGRDQGVTSAPTLAMAAAVRGEAFHIPYGGKLVFNYTADVARAFIAACRAAGTGAGAYNVPGTLADMRHVIAVLIELEPEAEQLITIDDTPLPLPGDLAMGGFERAVGPLEITPLAAAVRATVEHFRARR
ncbi:MAG: NAD-dependent epimerase/dehydratase family protein [Actinomycetia bacterium]|nr:NAD-dependent epimerase/dehydratase family protein [Actinomycetes bacterium]